MTLLRCPASTGRPRPARPATTRGPLAALALALSLAMPTGGCSGSGDTAPAANQDPAKPKSLSNADGQLLGYYRLRIERWLARSLVAYGATGPVIAGLVPVSMADAPAAATPGAPTAPDNFSTTVVQEGGVDEDDLVKTDGQFVYSLALTDGPARLQVHQLQPGSAPALVGQLAADGELAPQGLLLDSSSGRLAMLSSSRPWVTAQAWADSPSWLNTSTRIDVFQTAGAAAPQRLRSMTLDGNLIGARRIGSRLYLATRWYPRLPMLQLSNDPQAAAANRAAIDNLTLSSILPAIRIDNADAQPLVAERDCYLQSANGSDALDLVALVSIDLGSSELTRTSRCFAGGSDAFYMSDASLYLATSQYSDAGQASTGIHKFAIHGGGLDYRGSGEVPGSLGWDSQARSYRFGEYQGDLRVITFTGSTGWGPIQPTAADAPAPSPATLSVLREAAGQLQLIGSLPNARRPQPLGLPGQQVYATRFVGARAYLVTYRMIDPLYLVDLSDPRDPRQTGQLQAPGFSNYLYPLGERLLLGVGRSDGAWASQRTRLALIDVSDPAAPRQLDSREPGTSFSISTLDYSRHGIMLRQVGNSVRVALPVLENAGPYTGTQAVRRVLYRWDVNLDSQSLSDRPPMAAPQTRTAQDSYLDWQALASDRALSVGDQVHYFADGQFVTGNW